MSKLGCPCGEQISSGTSPNPNIGYVLKDIEADNLCVMDSIDYFNDLDPLFREVWECWSCGRLAVTHPDKAGLKVKWYEPSDGVSGKLFEIEEDGEE